MLRIFCVSLFASLCALLAAADRYPERPIRLVAPFPPGGGVDITARIVADPLGKALGQMVVVDNRPGAGGRLGVELVSKAAPDGYTLLLGGIGMAISRALYDNLPYDTLRDFIPISLLATQPNIMVAHPSIAAKSLGEFSALALPDVPTLAESGAPGYEYSTWYGLVAPAGVPRTIIGKLNKSAVAVLETPEVQKLYASQGLDPIPSTSAHYAAYLRAETEKWTKVVRAAKIQLQ